MLAIVVFGYMPATPAVTVEKSNLPLDVVLVMDSSGSMKRTDPQELRKPAAKLLVSLLGANDRASVVSFSDQGYPVTYFTPVKGKQNETKLFAAVDRISNKGVYTNLLGAVEGAMRVIDRDPLPNRKTIVVLMTDGKMDLGDSVKNASKSETLIKDLIPRLKKENIELHTIAFTDESDQAYLKQLAASTGGKFNLAQTDKQLHDVYTSIFEQNKQPNMLPFDGEKFTIDNAIKEVTIVGSKDNENVKLSLLAPNGQVISAANKPENVKWFTAQAFDLITVKNPRPGQWKLKSSTGKNKAYIITDLKFQLKIEPQEVAIGEGLMINAWLEDKGKTINKPSILSSLNMTLSVHTPEGATHELDMQAQAKEDGNGELSGVYLNYIAMPAAGQYQVEITAKGRTFSRVRNSLVNVVDPNAMTKADNHPQAQTHNPPEPATPDIKPAEPPVEAPTPETHTSTMANEPPPEAQEHAMATDPEPQQAHEKPHHEEPKSADQVAHDQEPKSTAPPEVEKPHKPVAETDQANEDNAAKESPNLAKALLIFLLINGVFALLGGGAFLFYRMKKKKAAKIPADEDHDAADEPEDEKRAA
jgi:Mg-chelatase subunit ChlD